jgi:hypothetical protein
VNQLEWSGNAGEPPEYETPDPIRWEVVVKFPDDSITNFTTYANHETDAVLRVGIDIGEVNSDHIATGAIVVDVRSEADIDEDYREMGYCT